MQIESTNRRCDMADEDREQIDVEELSRLNHRALRRVREFLAAFRALEAHEREVKESAETCLAGKRVEPSEKENGSK